MAKGKRRKRDIDPRGIMAAMNFVEDFADDDLSWETLKFFPFAQLKELRAKAQGIRRKFRKQWKISDYKAPGKPRQSMAYLNRSMAGDE